MPLSFAVDPTRYVKSPDGDEWTVSVKPGHAWPGWRWLDWLDRRIPEGWSGSPVPFLALLALPAVTVRRLRYVMSGRRDWRVTVYRGIEPDYRPRAAVVDEAAADRVEANARADELATQVARGVWPDQR